MYKVHLSIDDSSIMACGETRGRIMSSYLSDVTCRRCRAVVKASRREMRK